MYEYVEELNYKISEKNYIKSLRGLFKNTEIINLTSENKGYILSWHIIRKIKTLVHFYHFFCTIKNIFI